MFDDKREILSGAGKKEGRLDVEIVGEGGSGTEKETLRSPGGGGEKNQNIR